MANPEVMDQSVPDLAIHHPTLPAVVAEKLRQLIIDGTFKPGTWLNERDLCDQLKISRTPLREPTGCWLPTAW